MRLEVTRRADLAVRSLQVLSAADGRLKAPVLAHSLGTTAGFVAQVMNPLVRRGWVQSVPGPNGGYFLVADLGSVSVLAVIEAVDGATDQARCVVEGTQCNMRSPCALHVAWSAAQANLLRSLADTPVGGAGAGAMAR